VPSCSLRSLGQSWRGDQFSGTGFWKNVVPKESIIPRDDNVRKRKKAAAVPPGKARKPRAFIAERPIWWNPAGGGEKFRGMEAPEVSNLGYLTQGRGKQDREERQKWTSSTGK